MSNDQVESMDKAMRVTAIAKSNRDQTSKFCPITKQACVQTCYCFCPADYVDVDVDGQDIKEYLYPATCNHAGLNLSVLVEVISQLGEVII